MNDREACANSVLAAWRLPASILAVTVVLLSRPAPGFGAPADEQRAPKPKATRASASAPRVEGGAPPVLTPPPVSAPPAPPPSVPPTPTPASEAKSSLKGIEGAYAVEGGGEIKVRCFSGDFFYLASSDGWEGVGILDGAVYRGVFRHRSGSDAPDAAMGEQTIDWSDLENPTLRATYTSRRAGEFVQRWHRLADSDRGAVVKPRPGPTPPPKVMVTAEHRPEVGDYVYVEELPEAVTKVAPIYPDVAIEGVVVVQALVLEDGSVGDCRIVNSVPLLDDAAVAAVRQWRFKPALSAGRPVATWVAVPVRFTRH